MRKNIDSVIDAFHAGETYQDKTCRTDGRVIFSYAMPIAVRRGATVYVLDPKESPSATTSGQIRAVLAAFPGARTAGDEGMLQSIMADLAEGWAADDECRASRGDREDFHADG